MIVDVYTTREAGVRQLMHYLRDMHVSLYLNWYLHDYKDLRACAEFLYDLIEDVAKHEHTAGAEAPEKFSKVA